MENSLSKEKGLTNELGENNCFLNVVIQGLWHLKTFQDKFSQIDEHSHKDSNSCIFCALKHLFVELKYTDADKVPPNILREALSERFKDESRFQLGCVADASETWEAVLDHLHLALTGKLGTNDTAAKLDDCSGCMVHDMFSFDTVEQKECKGCKGTSEPNITRHSFIYWTWATEFIDTPTNASTGARLSSVSSIINKSPCPNQGCKASYNFSQTMIRIPSVFTVGFIWNTKHPEKQSILQLTERIDRYLNLAEVVHIPMSPAEAKLQCKYELSGMICYYGMHYNAYFYSRSQRKWVVFDDATVKIVGDWEQVCHKCAQGKFQPCLLFYEKVVPPPLPAKESALLQIEKDKEEIRGLIVPSPILETSAYKIPIRRSSLEAQTPSHYSPLVSTRSPMTIPKNVPSQPSYAQPTISSSQRGFGRTMASSPPFASQSIRIPITDGNSLSTPKPVSSTTDLFNGQMNEKMRQFKLEGYYKQ